MISNFIKTVGNLPNTFWGMLILFASMLICVKYNHDIGFYFAGVGSTLLGINPNFKVDPPKQTLTADTENSHLEVKTNAGDNANQS